MIWEYDAGWGRPLLNHALYDPQGRPLGIPDLFDPRRGVVGEFAGGDHRTKAQHARDLDREADFRHVGLEVVEIVARDFSYKPRIIRRMAEAESRALRAPQTWVLGPAPSPTLDEFLDARDAQDASSDPIGRLSTVENLPNGVLDGY